MKAWTSGDPETPLANLTDDVEIHVLTELANAGTFHGHDGFSPGSGGWDEAP